MKLVNNKEFLNELRINFSRLVWHRDLDLNRIYTGNHYHKINIINSDVQIILIPKKYIKPTPINKFGGVLHNPTFFKYSQELKHLEIYDLQAPNSPKVSVQDLLSDANVDSQFKVELLLNIDLFV
jgi:hypothetical protein